MNDLANSPFLKTTTQQTERRVHPSQQIGGSIGDLGWELEAPAGTYTSDFSKEYQGISGSGTLFKFNEPSSEPTPSGNVISEINGVVNKDLASSIEVFQKNLLSIISEAPGASIDLGKQLTGWGLSEHQPTPEEAEQIKEANGARAFYQETENGQASARAGEDQKDDEKAGLAGMSLEKRAQKAGVQGGFRLVEALRNSYTRVFTALKEKWTAQRESMKEQKPFEIVQGRFNKLGNLLKLNAQEGNSQVANQIMGAG